MSFEETFRVRYKSLLDIVGEGLDESEKKIYWRLEKRYGNKNFDNIVTSGIVKNRKYF